MTPLESLLAVTAVASAFFTGISWLVPSAPWKIRTGLTAAAILSSLFLAYLVGRSPQPSPSEAIRRYWDAVDAEDYDTAWAMLSKRFKNKRHKDSFYDFVGGYRSMHVCSVKVEALSPHEVSSQTAMIEGTVRFKAGKTCTLWKKEFTFLLTYSSQESWLIDKVTQN